MNILHINSNFSQSKIYPNMVKNFIQDFNTNGRVYYPVSKTFNINKIDNMDFLDISNCLSKYDKFFYFKRNKKLAVDISKIYDLNDFDVMISYSLFSNGYLAYTLKQKYDIPYIVIVQNTDVNMYFKKAIFLRGIGRKILRNSSKVIFLSKAYKENVLNNYVKNVERNDIEKKSIVIPFGIDEFWFKNISSDNKQNNINKIKLLFVGRINKNKNIITTIKACNYLMKRGYNLSFTVVGEIEDKRIADKILKHDYVNYIPFTNKDNLLSIYRENDIFIMPSCRESFGLVYAEAMSQGLPVIYSRGQGFDKQFTEGEIGYNVDCFDVKEIAQRIINISENYTYISKRCVNLVRKFQWSIIIKKYLDIIRQI